MKVNEYQPDFFLDIFADDFYQVLKELSRKKQRLATSHGA